MASRLRRVPDQRRRTRLPPGFARIAFAQNVPPFKIRHSRQLTSLVKAAYQEPVVQETLSTRTSLRKHVAFQIWITCDESTRLWPSALMSDDIDSKLRLIAVRVQTMRTRLCRVKRENDITGKAELRANESAASGSRRRCVQKGSGYAPRVPRHAPAVRNECAPPRVCFRILAAFRSTPGARPLSESICI
jgi:hypothetical protein